MGALIMPAFDTPKPITATIDVAVGDVRASAERADTVVDVRPSDASNAEDVRAAEQTRVEYVHGQLLVKSASPRSWLSRSGGGSIDVTIDLPAGSRLHGAGQATDFRCDGRLGDCRIRTGLGHIRLDRADALSLKCGIGDISVERATQHAEVTTGAGEVRLGQHDSSAVVKNSNGDTWVGVAGGDLRLSAANGRHRRRRCARLRRRQVLQRRRPAGRGRARLGRARDPARRPRGRHPRGDCRLARRAGRAGRVLNALEAAAAPEPSAETVEVRARTAAGSVVIRRP